MIHSSMASSYDGVLRPIRSQEQKAPFVQVWVMAIPPVLNQAREHPLFSVLSSEEQIRLLSAGSEEYQTQCLFSHALLRLKLSEHLNLQPHAVPLVFGERKKPSLEEGVLDYPLSVSISHASHAVAVAFGNCPLGVDIEIYREHKNFDELFRRSFANEEVSGMESLTGSYDRHVRFHQLWTLKEAFYKASQLPSVHVMEKTVFIIDESEKISFEMKEGQNEGWQFKLDHPLPASYLAVAVKSSLPVEINHQVAKPDEFLI